MFSRRTPSLNLRRRRGRSPTKQTCVPEGTGESRGKLSLRLVLAALVTVATLAATWVLVQDRLGDWREAVASASCTELRHLNEAVKRLGLDGLDEFRETCVSPVDRVTEASRPLAEALGRVQKVWRPLAEAMESTRTGRTLVAASLHRAVRRLLQLGVRVGRLPLQAVSGLTRSVASPAEFTGASVESGKGHG